jgi:hypothetical protein
MEILADILLAAGAFGAAAYCLVLSRRLSRLTRLEGGMGGAIAVLSAQVDDLTRALGKAQETAGGSTARLEALTLRAEAAAARLDLVLASLHDIPEAAEAADDGGERRMRFVRRRGSRAEATE